MRKRKQLRLLRLTALGVCLGMLVSPVTAQAQMLYRIMDLGRLTLRPGAEGGVMAMNEQGQVVGGNGHGFLWTDGSTVDLGTLPPTEPEDDTTEIAYGINNREQIVGTSGNFRPVFMSGLLFARGVFAEHRKQRQFTGHNVSFVPYAINGASQIVGLDGYRGFFCSRGKLIPLGTLSKVPNGNYSTARNINPQGQVVGWTTVNSSHRDKFEQLPTHAFLWQRGVNKGRMRDLGTLPGWANSYASAINRWGEIAGSVSSASNSLSGLDPDNPTQAFLWRSSRMTALPKLPGRKNSQAFAINDNTVVVGSCDSRAVIWRLGKMTDLNDELPPSSGWILEEARAINNRGQIAGNGTFNGQKHMFLLTPQGKNKP